ncbi:hypothetical protein Nepgr_027279 [Nepenthes gracilis]|uniref:Uncharacterized protein n=1 Tax=Nepenthes gracilis TaxID=150966 RepID=A0AAD3TA89_NEPGR|nr:hypothetical protein Nepgr_027279 [Nepenthes gracilis]
MVKLPKSGTCERWTGVPSISNRPHQLKLAAKQGYANRPEVAYRNQGWELVSEGAILPKRTISSNWLGLTDVARMPNLLARRLFARFATKRRVGIDALLRQDVVPTNLALGEALVGCGAPISVDVYTIDDKSQHMNLGHAVSCQTSTIDHDPTDADPIDPMEMALPVDQAKEGHVASVLKDNWQTNVYLISFKSFCLAHTISKELVMDVKDSINSFAVL